MLNILIVDDDVDMLEMLEYAFTRKGYTPTTISSPEDVNFDEIDFYDIIILDIMMPNISGMDLCKKIRNYTNNPILFLTAKSEESDIIFGLDIGADDYICKPFSMNNLYARVNALLRRKLNYNEDKIIEVSGITINLLEKAMFYDNSAINLTKKEYDLCLLFATHKNKVFSKEEIFNRLYGCESDTEFRVITQYVYQIRSKFMKVGIDPIKSIWGIGYQWK